MASTSSTIMYFDDNISNIDFFEFDGLVTKAFKPKPIFGNAYKYASDIYENLSPNRLYPIRLLQWRDPVNLWISLESMQGRIRKLDGSLQKWYEKCGPRDRLKNLAPGTPCAFKDRRNHWRRGMINMAGFDDTAFVRQVDVGGNETVSLRDIKPLWNMFADTAPSAINVRLFGVQTAELTQKLMKKAKEHFKKIGTKLACRFVDVANMYPFREVPRIELYDLNRLAIGGIDGEDMASAFVEFNPGPDEDLVAQSGIFMLHRGHWKSYKDEDWIRHRDHPKKIFPGHPDWITEDDWTEEIDENGLMNVCGLWLPPMTLVE